jgi:hypothetical protein
MGGYVGLTIRFSKDEVHKLEISTNSLIETKWNETLIERIRLNEI